MSPRSGYVSRVVAADEAAGEEEEEEDCGSCLWEEGLLLLLSLLPNRLFSHATVGDGAMLRSHHRRIHATSPDSPSAHQGNQPSEHQQQAEQPIRAHTSLLPSLSGPVSTVPLTRY